MTSKNETGLQIIAIQKVQYRLLNAVLGSVLILFAASAFMTAIFVTPLPVGSNIYAIPWLFVVVIIFLALLRNRILQFIFGRVSHSRFLSLMHNGKVLTYTIVAYAVLLFMMSFLSTDATVRMRFVASSFGLFFVWSAIFFIFSSILTRAGKTRLLFELLLENLDNFEERQPYLRAISRKVEDQLKIGNIKVPCYEFVYYFNMKLLKGTDIQNDLKNIESWIVDSKTPCFKSLKKIYPEKKLEPCKRVSLYRQLVETPTLAKSILYIVALVLLALFSPTLQSEIIRLLSRLLGI
jgi:hypothetical protein